MFFCIRWDLDYVPWDTPDALEYGHGEPAMLIRILDFARQRGLRFQFCASNRVLRAFSALGDAILDQGHDLDWYCKHAEEPDMRWPVAEELFSRLGKLPEGIAFRSPPPPGSQLEAAFRWSIEGQLLGVQEIQLKGFSVHDSLRSGIGYRKCLEEVSSHLCMGTEPCLLVIRPQDLNKVDPRLNGIDQILRLCEELGIPDLTLRQAHQSVIN